MLFVSYSFQFFDSSWGLLFLYTSDRLLCFHVILHHVSILTIRAIFDWIFLFPFLSWFMFCVSRRPCSPRCQTPSIQFIGKPSIIPNVFSSVQPYICRHIFMLLAELICWFFNWRMMHMSSHFVIYGQQNWKENSESLILVVNFLEMVSVEFQ